MIKAFVARHYTGLADAIQSGLDAITLSKETRNVQLQLFALESQAWSYLFAKNYVFALKKMQEADALFQQYTRLPNVQPLHPQTQGGIYSALAIVQAKNGIAPDVALGTATEFEPADEDYPFVDFKRSILFLEAGCAYVYRGDQAKAMAWLEKRLDPETLTPRIAQSELGRIETLNYMTLSALKAPDRDMEKTLAFWNAAMQGAIELQSEQRFSEALSNYELMEVIWPGEKRVTDLRERIVHWND